MRLIGFSSGSLARGDFRTALRMLRASGAVDAVELSALREEELKPLLAAIPELDLGSFGYVSVHLPSRVELLSELALVEMLAPVVPLGWPIVVHPDVIQEATRWRGFGSQLLIENMDKRKPTGRTASELAVVFDALPEARLCFDVGHARQIDPTMSRAAEILRVFGGRVAELHVSEVNARNKHEPLSQSSIGAFQSIAHLIPAGAPAIIESPVGAESLAGEIEATRMALSPRTAAPLVIVA